MKHVCEKHGALFILDEIMCGIGRTGTLHAWEQEDVVPDIQTIGKGLGAGVLPIAAMLCNLRVTNVLRNGSGSFAHGYTYQNHPVVCAAALEVLKIIHDDKLLENVESLGPLLESLLLANLSGHPYVGNIRGRGLFWGVSSQRLFSSLFLAHCIFNTHRSNL